MWALLATSSGQKNCRPSASVWQPTVIPSSDAQPMAAFAKDSASISWKISEPKLTGFGRAGSPPQEGNDLIS